MPEKNANNIARWLSSTFGGVSAKGKNICSHYETVLRNSTGNCFEESLGGKVVLNLEIF